MINRFFLGFIGIVFLISCNNYAGSENLASKPDVQQVTAPSEIDSINGEIKKQPNNDLLYQNRAKLLVVEERFEEAQNDLERAIAIDSLNADHYVLLSTLKFREFKSEDAKELLQKALKFSPEHVLANLKLGELYLFVDEFGLALDYVNGALKADKYNADGYFLKGMIYKMAGDTAKAVSTFQTCVEQNPDHYNGFIQLGLIYASINDDIAIAYYNNALQIYPQSTEALYNMALYYQNTERVALADKTYDKIIETNPEYFIAYYNKAFLRLVYSTDYDSAIYFFDKTLDYDETYFEAFYNKGYAYELKGDNKNAAAGYKSALALKPDFTLAAKGLNRVQ